MRRITFLVVSTIVSFVLIDITVNKFVPKPCDYIQSDNLVHHRLIPNQTCVIKNDEFEIVYHINEWGLRDVSLNKTKPEGIVRILFLGDSFIEGIGSNLEDTLVKQVESRLSQGFFPQKIQVINAGVSAYSPILEDLFLRHYGMDFQPDIVILGLHMTDFNEERMYLKKAHYNQNGDLIGVYVVKKQRLPKFISNYLTKYSFSYYVFGRFEEKLWKGKGKLVAWLKRQPPPDYTKSGIEFDPGNPDYDPFAITRQLDNETFEELFNPVTDRLLSINKYLKDHKIPFIIIVIPGGHQVGHTQWWPGSQVLKLTEDTFSDRVFEELKNFAKLNHIPLVNLTPGLRDYLKDNPDSKLYFDYDGHFTPLGNAVAAEEASNFLQDVLQISR